MHSTQSLVLIRKSGEVQVRKTTDLSLVRTFRIEGARDVVIAPDGTLWVIVGSRVERYALDGKRLPGIITDVGKPSALAIGNDTGQLIVCDDGPRQQVLFYDISRPEHPPIGSLFRTAWRVASRYSRRSYSHEIVRLTRCGHRL